jgi:hypothetical protein
MQYRDWAKQPDQNQSTWNDERHFREATLQ